MRGNHHSQTLGNRYFFWVTEICEICLDGEQVMRATMNTVAPPKLGDTSLTDSVFRLNLQMTQLNLLKTGMPKDKLAEIKELNFFINVRVLLSNHISFPVFEKHIIKTN